MKNKIIIIIVIILLFLGVTASAHPGIYITVDPIQDTVNAGEIAKYTVTVHTTPDVTDIENVNLFIDSPLPGWDYIFTPNDFDIGPDPDTKTSTLEVHVPSGTLPATYTKKIMASTIYGGIPDFETADIETHVNVTGIPEFPTVAFPVISVIGLMLLFQRKKGK